MGEVTVVIQPLFINTEIKQWVMGEGFLVGFLAVFEKPLETNPDLPYFDIFESTPTHTPHGHFLARLRRRRRKIGTLLFGKDWRTSRPTDEKNWVLQCTGTAAHLAEAQALATKMASHFGVNITVEHEHPVSAYEKFDSELD